MISLTPGAIAAIEFALEAEEEAVRVGVVGGGCSGYSYSLVFCDEVDDDDIVLIFDKFEVRIDPHSASLLGNTEIDYIKSLQSSGFVFNNPNAVTTCGCGMSFS